MTSIRSRALHYLLLRHLWGLRRLGATSDAVHREVAESLSVSGGRDGYRVTWTRGGVGHERVLPGESFAFFVPGDRRRLRGRAAGAGDPARANPTEAGARALACEALGLSDRFEMPRGERGPTFDARARAVVEGVGLGVLLGWLADGRAWQVGPFVAALAVVERAPELGAFLAASVFVPWAIVGFPWTSAIGALVLGAFQALDPDSRRRRARALAAFAAVLFCSARASTDGVPESAPHAALLALLAVSAIGLALARWARGIHRRALPVALPLLGLGLALDGEPAAALGALAASGLGLLAEGGATGRAKRARGAT